MTNCEERIREAFEDVPRIEDPDEVDQYAATRNFPSEVVSVDGPVPDPRHNYKTSVTVEVPDWVVYSVEAQLKHYDVVDEGRAEDVLLETVQIYANHVTEDGDRVVDLVLDRLAAEENGGDETDGGC